MPRQVLGAVGPVVVEEFCNFGKVSRCDNHVLPILRASPGVAFLAMSTHVCAPPCMGKGRTVAVAFCTF